MNMQQIRRGLAAAMAALTAGFAVLPASPAGAQTFPDCVLAIYTRPTDYQAKVYVECGITAPQQWELYGDDDPGPDQFLTQSNSPSKFVFRSLLNEDHEGDGELDGLDEIYATVFFRTSTGAIMTKNTNIVMRYF